MEIVCNLPSRQCRTIIKIAARHRDHRRIIKATRDMMAVETQIRMILILIMLAILLCGAIITITATILIVIMETITVTMETITVTTITTAADEADRPRRA